MPSIAHKGPVTLSAALSWREQLGWKPQCKPGQGVLGQPRPGGENEVGKVKGRFAGTGLCGPKDLEVKIIGVRLELVMEQAMQTRDWKKYHNWETGQEGERQKTTEQIPFWQGGQKGDQGLLVTEAKPCYKHHKGEFISSYT